MESVLETDADDRYTRMCIHKAAALDSDSKLYVLYILQNLKQKDLA